MTRLPLNLAKRIFWKDEISGKAQAKREQELYGSKESTKNTRKKSSVNTTDDVLNDYIEDFLRQEGMLTEDE